MPVPLPAPTQLLAAIRSSCSQATAAANIHINHNQLHTFIHATESDPAWIALVSDNSAAAQAHGVRLPLRFDSPEDELNLLATLALLNFLSGYRTPLHRLTSRGAYSTILSLVLSAYLSSSSEISSTPSLLTAAGFRAATPASLAALARINTHTEKPHPTLGPAVTVGEKDDEAIEVLELLAGVFNETGRILAREGNKKTLGAWLVDKLVETKGDVGELVVALASTFPAFNDSHPSPTPGGEPVYLFKKALWLLTVVSQRFSSRSGNEDGEEEETKPKFPLPDLKKEALPIFADNVLPSLLIHHSLLDLSTSTLPALASLSLSSVSSSPSSPPPDSLILPSPSAIALRAASLTCCARIVARAQELAKEGKVGGGWTEEKLDAWFWGYGKTEEGKKVGRWGERGTVYY